MLTRMQEPFADIDREKDIGYINAHGRHRSERENCRKSCHSKHSWVIKVRDLVHKKVIAGHT